MKKVKLWELLRQAESIDQRIAELSALIAKQSSAGQDITETVKELVAAYEEKKAFGRETVEVREDLTL